MVQSFLEDDIHLYTKCNDNFGIFAPISSITLGYIYMFLNLKGVNIYACRCILDTVSILILWSPRKQGQTKGVNAYIQKETSSNAKISKYVLKNGYFFSDVFLLDNSDILLFVYFLSCLQIMSRALFCSIRLWCLRPYIFVSVDIY
jgi:hypothetical protein